MGYRTVNHVPSIYTHAQAKQIHDRVVPIRGRDIKPLGQRRDSDTYHIRMNGDDVECVLYKTPVVTFHPDNTITLRTDNWNTVSTHQFIWAITGCPTRGSRGKTVVRVADKDYVITEQMRMKCTDGGASKWEVLTKEEQYDWQLDRQKANIVRAKYKEFITYLTGSMKLRTVQNLDYESVEFSPQEMIEQFGLATDGHQLRQGVKNDVYSYIDNKRKPSDMNEFIQLITAQGEDNTAAYYRAMLMLAGKCYGRNYYGIYETSRIGVSARSMLDKAYECMYKWHSDEVFVRVKLADGKVPTNRYDTWV